MPEQLRQLVGRVALPHPAEVGVLAVHRVVVLGPPIHVNPQFIRIPTYVPEKAGPSVQLPVPGLELAARTAGSTWSPICSAEIPAIDGIFAARPSIRIRASTSGSSLG
ncbi:hypothetical protein GCM10010452_00650 [Crossiella cryophila]